MFYLLKMFYSIKNVLFVKSVLFIKNEQFLNGYNSGMKARRTMVEKNLPGGTDSTRKSSYSNRNFWFAELEG